MANTKKNLSEQKAVHCINWMHDSLLNAYENGNRGAIKAEAAELFGVSESKFALYKDSISVLYEALCEYVRYGKSKAFMADPAKHEAELKRLGSRVYDLWRQILDWGEMEKDQRRIIVHPRDIEDLMTVIQRFQANAVNTEMDKGFVSQKVWATVPEGVFRNKVETILGIRMKQAEVMSDVEREYLRALNKLVGVIRKNGTFIENEEKNKATYERLINTSKSEEAKAEFKSLCEVCDGKIAAFRKKADEAQKKLDAIKGLGAEAWAKKMEEEKTAKALERDKKAEKPAAEEKAAAAKNATTAKKPSAKNS